MALVWLFVGLVIGFAAGVVLAAWSDWRAYNDAINVGFIKLNGRIFSITKIDV